MDILEIGALISPVFVLLVLWSRDYKDFKKGRMSPISLYYRTRFTYKKDNPRLFYYRIFTKITIELIVLFWYWGYFFEKTLLGFIPKHGIEIILLFGCLIIIDILIQRV